MTIDQLKKLMQEDKFHHATYRNHGTIWEGLWIYEKATDGFRGYKPVGSFSKTDPDLDAAHNLVRNTGVSLGSYGNG